MADDAFPLPGVTTVETITDWENILTPGLWSGVISGQGSNLQPSLDTVGRNAVIAPGAAILRGFYKPVSASTPTPIPAPSSQDRIDRLTLRLNRAATAADQFVVPTIITGTPAANPVEPALTQTSTGLWDLPICSWTSSASGALATFNDERYGGMQCLSGLSTARPAMPGPGFLYEVDTARVSLWTGSAWQYITDAPDTWHPFNLSNGFGGNIHGENQPAYIAVPLGGTRRGVAFRGVMDTPAGGAGNQITSMVLPAGYYPTAGNARWAVCDLTTPTTAAYMVINSKGQIIFQGDGGDQIDISGTAWLAP